MLAFLFLLALSACAGDVESPVAPEEVPVLRDENLVGTWEFDSSDFIDVIFSNFENLMLDLGSSRSEVDAAISEGRALFTEDSMFFNRFTFRLNVNGSYVDNGGSVGA